MIAEADTIDVFVVSKEDCSTYYQRKRQYQLGVHILAKKKKKKKERDNIFLIFVPMMSEMDIIDRIEVPRRDYCNYDHKERHY